MDQQFLTWLSDSIKEKFLLFQNKRSAEEDEKIYLRVYEIVFVEMGEFVYENLPGENQAAFKERYETLVKQEPQDQEGQLALGKELIGFYNEHLAVMENGAEKLKSHLKRFLVEMVEESMRAMKQE
jgi:hypothetical protein